MNDRLLSLLGLCRRSGRLVIGADPVTDSLGRRRSFLVLYADDFSERSLKPVLAAAEEAKVSAVKLCRSKEELSLALGRLCGVLSVEDRGFAKKLTQLIEQDQGGVIYDKV